MPDVLLIGENTFPFHSIDEKAPQIEAALGEAATVTTATDLRALETLDRFDILVDYLTDSHPLAEYADAIESFVASGGGYLGVHCAADLTSSHAGDGDIDTDGEPIPELRSFLGGHFVTHPEQSTFAVEVVDHPFTAGVDDFEVYDEPYVVEYDHDAVTVLAWMDHPDHRDDPDFVDNPVAWYRDHGDGRVWYSSLGHTDQAFEHEAHRRLLRNALDWLAVDGG